MGENESVQKEDCKERGQENKEQHDFFYSQSRTQGERIKKLETNGTWTKAAVARIEKLIYALFFLMAGGIVGIILK